MDHLVRTVMAEIAAAALLGLIGIEWVALLFAVVALATAMVAYANTAKLYDLVVDTNDQQAKRVRSVVEEAEKMTNTIQPDEDA